MGITIVTVVKNDPTGLNETLASINRQSTRTRLMVMDGHSENATRDVAHRWQGSLPLEFHSEADEGPYDAMNKALQLIDDDELVWFVNAGDTLRGDNALARAVELTGHPSFVWGFGPHCVLETTGELRRIEVGRKYSLANHAYGKTPICHQAVITRASYLRQVGGFDLRYPIAADYRSLLLLGMRWQPEQWRDVLVEYRAGGISDRLLTQTISQQGRARRQVLKPEGLYLVGDRAYDYSRYCRHVIRELLMNLGLYSSVSKWLAR